MTVLVPIVLLLLLAALVYSMIGKKSRLSTGPVIPCKICDRGELVRKRVYRLSAPVVVIGYILVTPSVIGILFSAYMLWESIAQVIEERDLAQNEVVSQMRQVGVPATLMGYVTSGQHDPVNSWITETEQRDAMIANQLKGLADMRAKIDRARSLSLGAIPILRGAGIPDPVAIALARADFKRAESWLPFANAQQEEAFRETEKQIYDAYFAISGASKEVRNLKIPDRVIEALADEDSREPDSWAAEMEALQRNDSIQRRTIQDAEARFAVSSSLGSVLGAFRGSWAIVFGIASLVGGLLGWLLIMKKRVLQCSTCGAVVNAS